VEAVALLPQAWRNTARAMPEENVEIVSRAIAAINDRDVDAYLALCDPDVELINPVAAIEGPNRGEAGIRNFFQAIDEAATRFELEVERLRPLGNDRVLAFLILNLESERGFPQRQPLTNLYDLKDGKLLRVRVFFDREEALEAAGLSE
jgi:ketosteroid isomerase-like protein